MAKVSDQTIAAAAIAAGFPADQIATAVAVALAESGGDATATHHNSNGSTDHGLWQINSVHKSILASGDWRLPSINARMAKAVWDNAGHKWTPWTTYKTGSYWRFIGRGTIAAEKARKGGSDSISAILEIADAAAAAVSGALAGPGGIGSPLEAVQGLADTAQAALSALTDRDTWIRAGMLLLATALIVAGIVGALWTLGGRGVVRKGARLAKSAI